MPGILFDDIGSFPLPSGVTKEFVSNAAFNRDSDEKLFPLLNQVFEQKINAGVHVPNYAQFRDMTEQFLHPIRDEKCCDGPFNLKEECAGTVEMDVIDAYFKQKKKNGELGKYDETGEKPLVRMCVTGPTELYLKEFGSANYADIYQLFAKNVNFFVRNAMRKAKYFKIQTVSLDEPSIGINPELSLPADEIITAMTNATRAAGKHGADVQIHIHSPLYYDLACATPTINVIGMESAATPSYMDMIDKKVLSDTDTFIRAGISRTDIFNMAGVLNEKYGGNVWNKPDILQKIVTDMETPKTIEKRLNDISKRFGDSIKYAGPDCGLGSWPTQELAAALLKNTGVAIDKFNQKQK
ncbi:methionine synthase [Methanolapillus millepedarum]|uniref:Methionine synthase n=1 Tax=Methanolapillus millepedarum TaxID=3028296 RepID=A0AA96V347_9EURY|nr:hypothetical protein MsAc7_12000 [Methanosarcinaceae archaeon Ac7]